MKDRDIEIGDIGTLELADVYAPPAASLTIPKRIETIARYRNGMLLCFFGLWALFIGVPLIGPATLQEPWLSIWVGSLAVVGLAKFVFIFLLNKRVNSIGDAIFRVFISIVPLFALYVLYRSTYDANKAIRAAQLMQD
mgnify:CR=1 FL=1